MVCRCDLYYNATCKITKSRAIKHYIWHSDISEDRVYLINKYK